MYYTTSMLISKKENTMTYKTEILKTMKNGTKLVKYSGAGLRTLVRIVSSKIVSLWSKIMEVKVDLQTRWTRTQKGWIAQIVGKDNQYGMERNWIGEKEGKNSGTVVATVGVGIYELCNVGRREYIQVLEDGTRNTISLKEVNSLI